MHLRPPEQLTNLLGSDRLVDDRSSLTAGNFARHLPRDRAELTLELPNAALARVAGHYAHHRFVGERYALAREARLLELARNQILLGDLGLLFLRVSGEVDDFHAVEQRTGNVLDEVACRDEENLTQVERN